MVSRTGDIVYAWVEPDTAYFIALSPHNRWADIELLNIVCRDFPHLLLRYELKGLSPPSTPLTEEERRTLRKKNCNVMIDIDGRVFSPPGGGRNSAGDSWEEFVRSERLRLWYEQVEQTIIDTIQKVNTGDGYEKIDLPPRMVLHRFVHEDRQLVLHDNDNGLEIILDIREDGWTYNYIHIRTLQ